METTKDVLNFCNAAIFYHSMNIGFIEELYQARKCIDINFYEKKPVTRTFRILSIIDVLILKIHDTDSENVIENNNDLRDIILHMLSFEKGNKEDN